MRVHADYDWGEAIHLKITSSGVDVPYCKWFDTELGIAECMFAVPYVYENKERTTILSVWDEDLQDHRDYYYTLHTFEVWDTRTNTKIFDTRDKQ